MLISSHTSQGAYPFQTVMQLSRCAGQLWSRRAIRLHSIIKPAEFYGVTTDDLLGLPAIKNHPNTDLNDLHLRDEMVKLLKSGRINNRLCSYTPDALLAELASFFSASHSPALSACRFVYPSTALLSFPDFLSERFFRPVGSLPSPSFCHL